MSLLGGFEGNINSLKNKIKNPFSSNVDVEFDENDFPEGFKIEEILSSGKTGEVVVLAGNWMPKIPFTFGGSVRMKKEYYSGYSEPAVQVFGPEEDDLTINGLFKDKKFQDLSLRNASTEMQQLIDSIRIRGNLVRLVMGEFERYAIIMRTKFDMEKLSRVGYAITFSVIGFNAPKNAVFLQRTKEVPFDINKNIIPALSDFENTSGQIPDTVPLSVADAIRSVTGEVASAVATVTDFVDSVFTTIQDVKSSINRVKGLIKFAQRKLKDYKKQVGGITSFDPSISIAGRYDNAQYSTSQVSSAAGLTALLEQLRAQFSTISNDLPLARHLVVEGQTLQNISVKFYGSSDDWKKIYDYNDLTSTALVAGTLLEIPRL